jgi:hypothetical protein
MEDIALRKNKKFVLWSFKLHQHTLSYDMMGYLNGFRFLGYDVYHFNDRDDVSSFDFSDCIILTDGQSDKNLPIIKGPQYILWNCDGEKYKNTNHIGLQIPTLQGGLWDNFYPMTTFDLDPYSKWNNEHNTLYQQFATDVFPDEIEKELGINNNKISGYVGTRWGGFHGNDPEFELHLSECQKYGWRLSNQASRNPDFSEMVEENRTLIYNAEIAPTISGKWQCDVGVVPCRIFKTISYGKLGITNNKAVYELMEGNVLYGESGELIERYLSTDIPTQKEMFRKASMLVAEKHTFLNRINTILKIFKEK